MKPHHNELISIIVPVYNTAKYLRECVDNILGQSYGDIEVILVDDGSTDDSPAVCDEYAASDNRVRVIHAENGGLSVARNRGLDAANGQWITFVDSDDMLLPESIEALHHLATSADADIATGGIHMAASLDTCKNLCKPHHGIRTSTGREATLSILYQNADHYGLMPSAWCKLFRAELFRGERFTPGILYEDLDLIPRIVAKTARVASTTRPVYFYRVVPDSILGKFNPRRFDVLGVCRRLAEYFSYDTALSRAVDDRLLSASFNMLMLMGRHGYDDPAREAECRENVIRLRRRSLFNRQTRFRNKAGIILSYILGTQAFKSQTMARFLKR